jgi:hypothetical protein
LGEQLTSRYLVLQPWTGSRIGPPIASVNKWFAQGVYHGWPKMQLKCSPPSLFCGEGAPLAAASQPRPSSSLLRCDRAPADGDAHIELLVGVMSAATGAGRRRRDASRQTWTRTVGRLLACFVLSSRASNGSDELATELALEAQREGDLLSFDVPEIATLSAAHARRAGFRRRRHGHCVFKNYAWLAHVAALWRGVRWIMKADDDTFVNVRPLLSLLHSVGCHSHIVLAPIMWTSWLNEVRPLGIASLPCAFSTGGLLGALKLLSQPITTLFNADKAVRRAPCDQLGAVPPFPFPLGGGFVLSAPIVRWLATDAAVATWVAEAQAAVGGERAQVTFFSDTTLGYWLSYAPHNLTYIDIGPWVHDHCCNDEAEQPPARSVRGRVRGRRQTVWRCVPTANNRPPASASLLVHGLKHGGFRFAANQTQTVRAPYDHARCVADVFAEPRTA